jgi:Tol biopolymer transport system component
MAFASVNSNADVWSLPVDHTSGKPTGELQRVTRDAAADLSPSPSFDSQRTTFVSYRSGRDEVWLRDSGSGIEKPITPSTSPINSMPVLTRDGSKLAYTGAEYRVGLTNLSIFTMPINRNGQTGVPQRLCENCGETSDWSVDGRKILHRAGSDKDFSLRMLDAESGQVVELVRSEHTQLNARFSPDGGWVMFIEVSGPVEAKLWVMPMNGPFPIARNQWILIGESPAIFRQACWALDGNLIYFTSNRDTYRCIWAQRLDAVSKRPRGAAFPVQHFHGSLSLALPNPSDVGLSASKDRLFFSLVESTGNIWMTKLTP